VIKDAAPLEARFTILEENKSCQQIISILKSMAIAVSLRPLFAHKFGNIELMNILPAGCKTPRARTRIQHSISAGAEFKHANIIATLFLCRQKRNLTLDHQAREKRETAWKCLGHRCREECGTNSSTSPSIPGFADMPFFPNPSKLTSKTCAPFSCVYNLNPIFVKSKPFGCLCV
jgi:hypothetical protein